jgi:hypothetical protein
VSDILDLYAAAGLTEIDLPSGFGARVRVPQPKDLIVRGILPTDLVEAVLAYTAAGKSMDNVGTEDPALALQLEASLRSVMADMIRQLRRPSAANTWEPVVIAAEQFATVVPREDQQAYETIALSAISGDAERGAGPDPLATFRRGADGNAAGADGGTVQPAPVDASGPAPAVGRAARRSRPRRAPQRG